MLSGGIASINVGTEGTPFDVHVELLCDCSPYFNRVFGERFTKPLTETISFPDTDPNTFTDFLAWLYRGNLFQDQDFPTWIQLCRLWVLASKLEVPRLQNLVMKFCKEKLSLDNGIVDKSAVQFIYENSDENSQLRCMAVDIWVSRMKKGMFESLKIGLPRHFLEDLCSELVERVEKTHEERNRLLESSFEARYFIELDEKSLKSRLKTPDKMERDSFPARLATQEDREEWVDPARLATPEQMANRKLLRPRSRSRSPGPCPADTKTLAIASTDAQMSENVSDIISQLGALKV